MKHRYNRSSLSFLIISLIFVQCNYSHDVDAEQELETQYVSENGIKAPRPSLGNDGSFIGPASHLPDLTGLIADVVNSILATTHLPSSVSGTVVGPSTSTINAVPRFANTLGTLLKNSSVLVDDLGNITIEGITKNGNTITWPTIVGAAGTFLSSDGAGNLVYATPAGGGNVSTALPFSTNNAITTVDLLSGVNNIKQSNNITLDSNDNITGVNTLNANIINATTINGTITATNFTGFLAGDVVGTQSATVVSFVDGQTAANVAAATLAANDATNANTPNAIVKRDALGNFVANVITANVQGNVTGNLTGNATSATTAESSNNFTGPLIGDVIGTQGATVVSSVDGQSAASVASGVLLANAATNNNTSGALVRRDVSGNFSAGIITANLMGNVTGNLIGNASSATTATDFNGSLAGDVTGLQAATVVATVGGQPATNVASGVIAANAATPLNTPNTLVERDASGNFAAGTITANLAGNATTATSASNASSAINFTGSLVGDVTGNQNSTVVASVGGQTDTNVASGVVAANAATNTNTADTIVKRDGSGNFAASSINANLVGNVTGNLSGNAASATTAASAINFTGSLSGDVTGNQNSTLVTNVGGETATAIAAATTAANAATSNNSPSTIIRRDSFGNFSATTVTADVAGNLAGNVAGNVTGNLIGNASTATLSVTSTNFSGPLVGDVTGTQDSTVVATVGGQSAVNVASAAIEVAAATRNDSPNTLVFRDGSGSFATNKITIDGMITNPNDAATKAYVDSIASLGLEAKEPAVVVSTSEVALSGLQTIDGVTLIDGDRVLLVAQVTTLPAGVENGLWVAHAGTWIRPADFASGATAGQAYVLILSGTLNAGSSWLCSTPTAVIDTNSVQFAEFSLPNQTNGANVGTGAGQLFRDKTGVTLNFKTIAASSHIIVTNNADDVNIAADESSINTANTLVARDALGNFAAGTITAALTGAASQNVLKTGDTMTGNLNLATQSEMRWQDASGGEYVGFHAPATVGSSYTVDLPNNAPTAGQILQATSSTSLQWETIGGSPATAEKYYVSLSGNDSNDGSFSAPFRTISHAVVVANSVASVFHPIVISVGAGIFVENNSGGPITISADGISIVGSAVTGTIIVPTMLSNDLFRCTSSNVSFLTLTLDAGAAGSSASAINLVAGSGQGGFQSIIISRFQTGLSLNGTVSVPILVYVDVILLNNAIAFSINNARVIIDSSIFLGNSVSATPANTALVITGTNSLVTLLGNSFRLFSSGISATGGCNVRVLGSCFETTTTGIFASGSAVIDVVGSKFIINNSSSTNVISSGAATLVTLDGCEVDGNDSTNIAQGTAVQSIAGASLIVDASTIKNVVVGIKCGQLGDTASTRIQANATTILNCITDVMQQGSSTLQFVGGTFDTSKILMNNTTNVDFAAFDNGRKGTLTLGSDFDDIHRLYQILNGQASEPNLTYYNNYYGNKGTVYQNPNSDPTFNATQAQSNDASYYVVTGDRTKEASINLVSDTGNFGVADNIRGWGIDKVGTSANLAFTYTNNDTSGQAARGSNSVIQFNGFDNQVEFPLATNVPLPTNTVAKLVWAGDTILSRTAANTLKTDGNFVVGNLTSAGVVHNDANGLLSTSLIVDADVSPNAAITDNKLATITTAEKVANSATTATSTNTPNTIVLRDGSGSFSAANITAALTGAASQNVLKTGDTMTGNLNLATQSEVRWQDASGGEYVGFHAPATVGSSYTVDLPNNAPTAGQVLQASSLTALQWGSVGGSPTIAKEYYVSLSGSDSNDGSFSAPFRTVSHAVAVANGVAALNNPIVISVGAGTFVENNSGGPITITADGISVVGNSINGTVIVPSTLSNDLFRCSTPNVFFINMRLDTLVGGSTASAINFAGGAGQGGIQTAIIARFQTGLSLNSSLAVVPFVILSDLVLLGNATAISINNVRVVSENCIFRGQLLGTTPINSALSITGASSLVTLLSNSFRLLASGLSVTGGSNIRLLGSNFETTVTGISCTGGSTMEIVGSNFAVNDVASTNIMASGLNSTITIDGCNIDGLDAVGIPRGTALQSIAGAILLVNATTLKNTVTAIKCGQAGDSNATEVCANSTTIINCTTDIVQAANAKLHFVGGVFDINKLSIADATNVGFVAFDRTMNEALTIGNTADTSQIIYQVLNNQSQLQNLKYMPNYYGNKGTVYSNPNADATFNGIEAQSNNASYYIVTGDRTKEASINLISDTANFGNGDNMRGWGINKVGISANLAFTYTNNDTSGQAARGSNSVMQLNGFDNQVEFPLATSSPLPTNTVAKLLWAEDTALYRSLANTLKTDGNFVIGGLSSTGVVHNDANGLLSTSLIVNADISSSAAIDDNKLATISTAGKIANSATTATTVNTPNTIVLRDGSGNFAANTITANLIGNATSANTTTTAINFTGSLVGDVTGTQSATIVSLVGGQTASNVASGAVLANASTSANTANSIVKRDALGNFNAGTISANLTGNATTATNATTAESATNFTGSLVGDVTGTQGATMVNTVGGQTAANVASGSIQANAATNVNTPNTIVKRDASGNFSATNIAANLTGNVVGNLSGNATTATSAFTAGTTTNFTGSLVGDVTGTQSAIIVSLVGGQTASNVASGAVLANASTNANTANSIVKRDALGNFNAGTISANLTGNATTATSATTAGSATNFTGPLVGDVTGTQGATVVNTVGGQTASNIAAATVLANAATSANTASAIVRRDASGNFVASTITGFLTGAASLNVLKAGDIMTGSLTLPAGTAAIPSLQFAGSTNTGLSSPTTNTLSFSTNALQRMNIDTTGSITYKSNYKLYAYRSTNQTINTTTSTIIFDVELLDPNANYNIATGVYTVPVSGTYMINVTVTAQTASQPSTQTVNIVKNGVAVTGASVSQVLSTSTAKQPMTTCVLLPLIASDLIRIDCTTTKNDTILANDTHLAISYMSF